jgi:ADP-ribose pyrophosphatase YjhB (NUDIX family)
VAVAPGFLLFDRKMRLLATIQRKPNIPAFGRTSYRDAVRAIILDGSRLMMIFAEEEGDYKFPGGGVDTGETLEKALAREVREECGLELVEIMGEFGKVIEIDRPSEPDYERFEMTSYYFQCRVSDHFFEQALGEYERDLGFRPEWVELETALATNRTLIASTGDDKPRWTVRETFVLEKIQEELLENA